MTHTSSFSSTIFENSRWYPGMPSIRLNITGALVLPEDCHGAYIVLPYQVSGDINSISGVPTAGRLIILAAQRPDTTAIVCKNNSTLHLAGSDFTFNNRWDQLVLLSIGSNEFIEVSQSDNGT